MIINILTAYHTCPNFFTSHFYCLLVCLETTGLVANSVDPDQMPLFVASDLGLHCYAGLSV